MFEDEVGPEIEFLFWYLYEVYVIIRSGYSAVQQANNRDVYNV